MGATSDDATYEKFAQVSLAHILAYYHARIVARNVLILPMNAQLLGLLDHLGRAQQRLEAAVKERERSVRHLELGVRRELVVELLGGSGALRGERGDRLDHKVDEAVELGRAVMAACAATSPREFRHIYDAKAQGVKDKIETIVREVYGGAGAKYSPAAEARIASDTPRGKPRTAFGCHREKGELRVDAQLRVARQEKGSKCAFCFLRKRPGVPVSFEGRPYIE